jgi:hypothetical protein
VKTLLAVLVLAALAATAAPAPADEIPIRDCGTRAEPTKGRLKFANPGDIVIGPLSFSQLAKASRPRGVDRTKEGRFFRKAAVKVLRGSGEVTLVVPAEVQDRLFLNYAPLGTLTAAVRFATCPPGLPMHNGLSYKRVTGYSGAFVFTERGCYPLEVHVEHGRTYRATVSLGGGKCA